jgi:hypothetical protein
MYLGTIEHDGRSLEVELNMVHDGRVPGMLE